SGMGIPSIGIYSYELIKYYGVENIIRVGSAGAYNKDLKLYDVILAMGSSSDSNFAHQYQLNGHYSAIASCDLLYKAIIVAEEKDIQVYVGNVLSYDIFYNKMTDEWKKWEAMGVLAV